MGRLAGRWLATVLLTLSVGFAIVVARLTGSPAASHERGPAA